MKQFKKREIESHYEWVRSRQKKMAKEEAEKDSELEKKLEKMLTPFCRKEKNGD